MLNRECIPWAFVGWNVNIIMNAFRTTPSNRLYHNGIKHLKNFKGDVKKMKHMIVVMLKVSLINIPNTNYNKYAVRKVMKKTCKQLQLRHLILVYRTKFKHLIKPSYSSFQGLSFCSDFENVMFEKM